MYSLVNVLNIVACYRIPITKVAARHIFSARKILVDRNNNIRQSCAQLQRRVIQILNVAVTVKNMLTVTPHL